jgi:ABC-2 type transport system ATP-binding protein
MGGYAEDSEAPIVTQQNAVEIHELTRTFGTLTAVDHLSLTVSAGSVMGLLGSNGAGKTTAIKMLTTLLTPTSGSATVAGFDVVRSPLEVRQRIGYVPQLLSADSALTGRENLMLSGRLNGVPRAELRKRVQQTLDFMGLGAAANRLVRSYSGGMIRALEIGQSMLHRPAVLFLDEPTVGLDPNARHGVWERLRQLVREFGTTVLLTTHDMEEADTLCGDIALMHRGMLAVHGPPAELKAKLGPEASLEDVFIHYTGGTVQDGGNSRDIARTRRTAHRIG